MFRNLALAVIGHLCHLYRNYPKNQFTQRWKYRF